LLTKMAMEEGSISFRNLSRFCLNINGLSGRYFILVKVGRIDEITAGATEAE